MKDIIQANIENIKLRQIVKDLTDNLIAMETEIELRDSRIESLEDTVAELKAHIIDEDDANHIYGFRYVRTAGELVCESEREPEVLCLNAAADGQDIADQIHFSGKDVGVNKILFGKSKYDKKENKTDD